MVRTCSRGNSPARSASSARAASAGSTRSTRRARSRSAPVMSSTRSSPVALSSGSRPSRPHRFSRQLPSYQATEQQVGSSRAACVLERAEGVSAPHHRSVGGTRPSRWRRRPRRSRTAPPRPGCPRRSSHTSTASRSPSDVPAPARLPAVVPVTTMNSPVWRTSNAVSIPSVPACQRQRSLPSVSSDTTSMSRSPAWPAVKASLGRSGDQHPAVGPGAYLLGPVQGRGSELGGPGHAAVDVDPHREQVLVARMGAG